MARRTKDIEIKDPESRDNGKTYVVTEMSAEAAEWWAFRVLQAILGANAEIDLSAPLAQMAAAGFKALGQLDPQKAKPLLDEMMKCVSVRLPDGKTRDLLPSTNDIEEVKTRVILRKEVFALHVDFFQNGGV